jgi:FAD:protein FMN transferase
LGSDPARIDYRVGGFAQCRTKLERLVRHWRRRFGRRLGFRLRGVWARCGPDRSTCGQGRPPTIKALELDKAGLRAQTFAPFIGFVGDRQRVWCGRNGSRDGGVCGPILVDRDRRRNAREGFEPGGSPWAVALERPERGSRDVMGVIELTDMAVATSGNYRHWVDMGGETLWHTMNPRTGTPLKNSLASASVLAATCMEADAWATVLMVLGEKAGQQAAKTLGIDAIFVH